MTLTNTCKVLCRALRKPRVKPALIGGTDLSLLIINKMYLRYYLDDQGKRVYTFKFHDPTENPTLSAHPGK